MGVCLFCFLVVNHTAGSRNRFEGMESVCTHTKTQKTISKRHFFLMEKCFEDVRQDEKHVLDLLEAIIRPTDPVKEELRPISFKMTQLGSKIEKVRVCTFQMSGKIPDSTNVASEAVILTHPHTLLQYLAPLGAKYMEKQPKNIKKCGF